MTLPGDPGDRSCEVINGGVLLEAVQKELLADHIEINGLGLGPCGTVGADLDAWNLSISVLDWHEAATAVQLLAETLARYDVADHAGVGVHGIGCAIPL